MVPFKYSRVIDSILPTSFFSVVIKPNGIEILDIEHYKNGLAKKLDHPKINKRQDLILITFALQPKVISDPLFHFLCFQKLLLHNIKSDR